MTSSMDLSASSQNCEFSDCEWSVVLYALGEGSAEERSAFESRLENDQRLCEELIKAVQLIELTRSVVPAVFARPQAVQTRRAIPRVIVAIGSLAITLGLAIALAGVRNHSPSLADAVLVSQVDLDPTLATESETDNVDGSVDELGPPDWLFTALDLEEQSEAESRPVGDDSEI